MARPSRLCSWALRTRSSSRIMGNSFHSSPSAANASCFTTAPTSPAIATSTPRESPIKFDEGSTCMMRASWFRVGGPPKLMVESSFLPRNNTRSASRKQVAVSLTRESAKPKQYGWASETRPRAASSVNSGTWATSINRSRSSREAEKAPLPATATGRWAVWSSSIASRTLAGSPGAWPMGRYSRGW